MRPPNVILIALALAIPLQMAEALENKRNVNDLIAALGSEDFNTREVAQTELRKMGMQAIQWLIAAEKKSNDAEVNSRIDLILEGIISPWVSQLASDLRSPAPWATKNVVTIVTTFEKLPPDAQKRFISIAKRDFNLVLPEKLKEHPAIRARVGNIPAVRETILSINQNGSGELRMKLNFRLIVYIRDYLIFLESENHTKLPDPEDTKDLGEYFKEFRPEIFPKGNNGAKVLADDSKVGKDGTIEIHISFDNIDSLNRCLDTTESPFRETFIYSDCENGILFQRKCSLLVDVLETKNSALDGAVERFVLKSDREIRRSSGTRLANKEVEWKTVQYASLNRALIAAEIGDKAVNSAKINTQWKSIPEYTMTENPRTGKFESHPCPLSEYYIRMLFSDDVQLRRRAAYLLMDERSRFVNSNFDQKFVNRKLEIGRNLISAMKGETEFENLVAQQEALQCWFGKELLFNEIERWESALNESRALSAVERSTQNLPPGDTIGREGQDSNGE